MTHQDFLNEDLELFADYLGLDGIDADLFYESYYQLKNEDIEEDDSNINNNDNLKKLKTDEDLPEPFTKKKARERRRNTRKR